MDTLSEYKKKKMDLEAEKEGVKIINYERRYNSDIKNNWMVLLVTIVYAIIGLLTGYLIAQNNAYNTCESLLSPYMNSTLDSCKLIIGGWIN